MKTDIRYVIILILLCASAAIPVLAADSITLDAARDDIAHLRYREANEKLLELSRTSEGAELRQALLLLAKLERSPGKAVNIYEEIISNDPESAEAKDAVLELAKIRYAAGEYREALRLLRSSDACDGSEEACYFEGLSAMMANDFRTARDAFGSISRGTFGVWSALSLAELDMNERNPESACERYHTLAKARVNPVAIYRYAECLERQGNKEDAAKAFEEIVDRFQSTPEAVLAAEKLKILRARSETISEVPAGTSRERSFEEGYTIQFGSFRDRQNAIKLAERIKKTLPGVRIDTDLIRYREVHRVRFGFFQTRDEARAKADEIAPLVDSELTIMKIP